MTAPIANASMTNADIVKLLIFDSFIYEV